MKYLFYILFRYKYPLLLLVFCLLFTQRIILHSTTPLLGGDIQGIYLVEKTFLIESIYTFHTLPLWNPYSFSGIPFLASSTPAVFYPLTVLFFILPIANTFTYIFVLDVFLAGLFTYLFARKIQLSGLSAFVSALCFMCSGVILSRIIPGHIYIVDSILWFPLLLFFLESYFQDGKLVNCVLAGGSLGLMILAGGAQFAFSALLATVIFTLFRNNAKKSIRSLFLLILIAFSLSAVQILPSQEFSHISTRSPRIDYTFATDFSLHPLQTSMFLFPFSVGSPVQGTYWGKGFFHETSGYAGIAIVFFASYALFSKKQRKYALIFLALLLFSLFLAYGKYMPFYRFFYSFIPGFTFFRVPSRFLFITTFSLVILGGIGLETFFSKTIQKKSMLILTGFWLFAGFCAIASLCNFTKNFPLIFLYKKLLASDPHSHFVSRSMLIKQFTADVLLFAFITCVLSILIFLKQKNKITRSFFAISIIMLTCLDMGIFSSHIMRYHFPRIFNNDTQHIARILQSDKSQFRVFDLSGKLFANLEQMHIEQVTGLQAMQIKKYKQLVWLSGQHADNISESFFDFDSLTNTTPLDMLNVTYITSDKSLSNQHVVLLLQEGKFYVYKNTHALPRAFTVEATTYIPNDKDVLTKISASSFDPAKQAIIQTLSISVRGGSYTPAKFFHYSPNKWIFSLSVNTPSFLIISNPYYPGWKAYDNGKLTPLYQTDYALSGIKLQKGNHIITYIYDPLSFEIGFFISLLSLLLIFYLCVSKLFMLCF